MNTTELPAGGQLKTHTRTHTHTHTHLYSITRANIHPHPNTHMNTTELSAGDGLEEISEESGGQSLSANQIVNVLWEGDDALSICLSLSPLLSLSLNLSVWLSVSLRSDCQS